ncbi:MAG: FIST C-terminal domain-containing protein [Alphaproteobacteria bacterium]
MVCLTAPLGEAEAAALPGSALLYPLKVSDPARPEIDLVRTVLAVDQQARTMTFAGDMPEGWVAQLMRGTMDRLAAGAAEAASQARGSAKVAGGQELAILVSCIGRKLLMGQRAEDEIEAAVSELGPSAATFGFYSYGELAPHPANRGVELHNQTMTVTLISEAA